MKQIEKVDRNHPAFREEVQPYYDIIMEGLKGEIDGECFWDAVAEHAIFKFFYSAPNFPNLFEGRQAYMDWFGGYDMTVKFADNLEVYKDNKRGIVVLEYQTYGNYAGSPEICGTQFCSIITIKERKIVHWRDYIDCSDSSI